MNLQWDEKLAKYPQNLQREIESWIVNNVKLSMVKKYDGMLQYWGQANMRQVFLVPVFEISEMIERVSVTAPELKTVFFKELMAQIERAIAKFS